MSELHTQASTKYSVSERNRVRRRHERGHYDHETVHALLDAAALCHVAYVIAGQPFCTPTLFWREGSRLFWHGSSASRMLRNLSTGESACLTVTHLDSLVLARSGYNHSADYRSVMAFGRARLIDDLAEKRRALTMMVDRFFPNRTASLRPPSLQELAATSVVWMDIEDVSAKIRARGVVDEEDDYALPIYAERLPVRMVIGEPEACPRVRPESTRPLTLADYSAGELLETALQRAYARAYSVGD